MDGHEVEAETVDMVFIRPVFHRIDDVVAHLLKVGGRLVAATGCVGIAAVVPVAVVVAGSGQFEVGTVVLRRMVVDHIHDHADSCVVERLHHLLHLLHARCGIGWIGRVAALGGIVVLRVVAPVVLVFLQGRLVDGIIVIAREDMHVGHSEFLQMVDAGGQAFGRKSSLLGQREKLTLVRDA